MYAVCVDAQRWQLPTRTSYRSDLAADLSPAVYRRQGHRCAVWAHGSGGTGTGTEKYDSGDLADADLPESIGYTGTRTVCALAEPGQFVANMEQDAADQKVGLMIDYSRGE